MNIHITQKDLKQLYNQLKQSAKKRGINFDLTMSDLNNLSFPITCPVLNIPLAYNRGLAQDNSFSVDRKDSTKGYTTDNIIVVSNRVNKLKSDASLEEMQKIVNFYSKLNEFDTEGFED